MIFRNRLFLNRTALDFDLSTGYQHLVHRHAGILHNLEGDAEGALTGADTASVCSCRRYRHDLTISKKSLRNSWRPSR